MKIALIHYHLKMGGVTTVIRQQVKALNDVGWEVMVLTGGIPPDDFPAEVQFIPGLGYEHLLEDEHSVKSIVQCILSVLLRRWPKGPDVVHVHNPTLAKNQLLQSVLKSLKASGLQLLCQIHDFAEDGRPGAYFSEPYISDCHYATINQRDYHILIDTGLVETGCHLLPNPVSISHSDGGDIRSDDSPGVLYPVRAIRRKNIGEAILLTLFHQPPATLAITQPPNSSADIESYLQWQRFVKRHKLPIVFDAGVHTDFNALMANCQYVITTSITEGFGFAFIEAWLAGKPLWGRLLPDICKGFIDAGVGLDHLYDRLWIPLDWLNIPMLSGQWRATMGRIAARFKHPCSHAEIDAAWHAVTQNNQIDFGLLDEISQQTVIEKLIKSQAAQAKLLSANPFLSRPGPPQDSRELIEKNAAVVVRHYSPENYSSRLTHLYTHVVNNDVTQSIDKSKLLSAFFNPEHFSLLKWGGLQ